MRASARLDHCQEASLPWSEGRSVHLENGCRVTDGRPRAMPSRLAHNPGLSVLGLGLLSFKWECQSFKN